MYTCDARLWRTEDDRLVPEGDPDARFLFCSPGDEIPDEEAERYGLPGRGKKRPADKAAEQPADKEADQPANKAAPTPARRGRPRR
jgi:uncharacterized membrane protein